MKKIIVLWGIIVLVVSILGGCNSSSQTAVSMYELNHDMCAATEKFSEMKYASNEDANPEEIFANISDFDYSKVNSFFVTYAENGKGNADEIVAWEMKNKNEVGAAADALRAHLERRTGLYSTYDKTQLKKLERGKVITYGKVAVLIVADDVEAIEAAFYAYFADGVTS